MKDVAVDACCLINLLAAGSIFPALSAFKSAAKAVKPIKPAIILESKLHISSVVANESLYLLQPDDADGQELMKVQIDLSPYFEADLLRKCDVKGKEETKLFVHFSAKLDDGEATCVAIAKNHGWTLATDDRLAMKLAGENSVPVITTVNLVSEWAKKSDAAEAAVSEAIRNIQRFAKFVPRTNSPDAKWWFSHTEKS